MKLANILLDQSKVVKTSKVLLEQQDIRTFLKELDSYATELGDKLYTYDDKDLVTVLNKLEKLLPSSATSPDTLIQNIADFVDDILDAGDVIDYGIFDQLESLKPMDLFDFYADFEMIVHRLIEHIEGNIMYDRRQERSGRD